MDNVLTLMVIGISIIAVVLMAYLVSRIYKSNPDSENS